VLHAIRRLGAFADPMLDALHVQFQAALLKGLFLSAAARQPNRNHVPKPRWKIHNSQ
jgi:hypothetical protein